MRRPPILLLVSILAFPASAARRHAVQFPSNPQPVVPQTVVLAPSRDATLYLTSDGSLADGTGPHVIVGATNGFQLRRALLAFDMASQIPPGSHVTRVALTLRLSRTISGSQSIELHRVTADWGEGPSNAGTSRDGLGASAKSGDATWIHTFFPDKRWAKAGGDFTPAADAAADAGGFGDVTWESSAAMIARVQSWVDQPSTNFGWILIGNETTAATTKEFDSREVIPGSTRPALTVEFTK
jgi:hypothetical protein